MIDLVLNNDYRELKGKRDELVTLLTNAKNALQEIGLPKNFVKLKPQKAIELYGKEKVEKRGFYSKLVLKYEHEINEINRLIKPYTDKNHEYINEILREMLTRDQWVAVKTEAKRRIYGEPPIKLSFGEKRLMEEADKSNQHKKIASKLIILIKNARESLNSVILDGCKKYGNADFLTMVSPINKALPPLIEIDKLRKVENI